MPPDASISCSECPQETSANTNLPLRACFLGGRPRMRHSAITIPIVKELDPVKLDAQGPHLAVPGDGKVAHGIEPRPLPVVDGDRDPLAGHRALDKVPAHDVLQDTFTGVVRLDHVSVVKVDAQGIILVLTHSDN